MANEEQLSILKQGVDVWNKWREENSDTNIDLSLADLSGASLKGADLTNANLKSGNLSRADLKEAYLRGAYLMGGNLSRANLREAHIDGADLTGANLRQANLSSAEFREAHLWFADLTQADLSRAILYRAKLSSTNLTGSNFYQVRMGGTILGGSDLSMTIGLEDIDHWGSSSISTDVFGLSNGKIPEVFLRGCGLSDWEIEMVKLYNPELSNDERNKILYKIYDLQSHQAIQISPLFISYNHSDGMFVDKLETWLNKKGVRFWRDIHDMKSGRMEKQIDRAISQNRTVLLILSEHSLSSDWVEHEVRAARAMEKEMGRDVLCPVSLDDSWKSSRWPKRLMEQIMEYNILDFSAWRDDSKFDGMFRKLIDGLELFYKG